MSDIYFSAKNNGFYSASLRTTYENSASGWPDDAIRVTDDDYKKLLGGQAQGKVITANDQGKPCLTEPLAPTKAQLMAVAKDQVTDLLTKAAEAITPLQDAVDVDDATDAELASLMAWKKFRVALNRLDLSTAPDIVWPEEPGDVA